MPDTESQNVSSVIIFPNMTGESNKFATQYGFQDITSSLSHPQAKGQDEKGLKMVKRLLKKASDSKTDPYIALLNYRAAVFGVWSVPC